VTTPEPGATVFDRFALVVVPFPFLGERPRPRPAVVVSTRAFNEASGHSVLAMVTTQAAWPTDHVIRELRPTGLPVASVIRLKLFTLDNRLIARRIGALSEIDAAGLDLALRARLAPQPRDSGETP
jgi:mRNA interferase MazF